jgi:hypothetical protein
LFHLFLGCDYRIIKNYTSNEITKNRFVRWLLCAHFTWGQGGEEVELNSSGKAYRDSIAALNQTNAQIARSQEAYNKGITLFEKKNYAEAIKGISINLCKLTRILLQLITTRQ